MEMKLTVVLAVLVGTLVLACSTAAPAPAPAEPTPNIDATVVAGIQGTQEAKVAQERSIDATVEARLNEAKTSQPTSGPSPTDTPMPVPTSVPMLAPTPEPAPTDTPTLVPTASPVPIPTPTPNPSSRQDELARLQGLTLEELAAEVRAHNAKLELERAKGEEQITTLSLPPTPTPALTSPVGRFSLIVTPEGSKAFTGKTVRFKIGELEAAESFIWEQGGATVMNLTVGSWGEADNTLSVNIVGRIPPHVFTGTVSIDGNLASIGTAVSAWVDGKLISESIVSEELLPTAVHSTKSMFDSLATNLQTVWKYFNGSDSWQFYVPDFETWGINTYTDAAEGDIVWILVNSNQGFDNQTLFAGWNLWSLPSTSSTTSVDSYSVFGDGTWVVGSDIQAGTYRSSKTSSDCYWERLSGFSGELDDIIANGVTDAIWVVEIASTDAGFSTERCGTWTEATSATTSSLTSPFGDGVFLVGMDISPGTWKSPGGDYCYWARLSGFSGELGHIKTNGAGGSNNILTIEPADKGFESSNCGTWTKTG